MNRRAISLDSSDDLDVALLGDEVRKLRKAKGLTLGDIAQAIGRSVSFVSQLERGNAEPSIQDLKGIANTLGVPLGWFFLSDHTPKLERGIVVRATNRRQLGTASSGLLEELLSPDIGGAFETFLSTFEPGAKSDGATVRETEEEGYVVKGTLDLWIGDKHFRLHAGDSFRIVREAFRWANPGDDEAIVVWIIAPPTY